MMLDWPDFMNGIETNKTNTSFWKASKLDWPDFMNGIETVPMRFRAKVRLVVGLTGLYERDWNPSSSGWNLSANFKLDWPDFMNGIETQNDVYGAPALYVYVGLTGLYERDWNEYDFLVFYARFGWTDRTLWTGLKP